MNSRAKLTYGGVARALGFTSEAPPQPAADELVEGLRVAYECSRILRTQRMKRGALDFDLPEAVVKLDEQGQPKAVTKRAQDPGVKKAYQLIEELMIFANEVVARWLIASELPGVFRVHLAPDPQKLERLAAMCEALGIDLDIEDTQTPKGLSDLLRSFADHPNANVLNNLLLRSMKQATYDVANLGHFGLASQAYLHFTSPIRRYPDLVVHRVVHAALETKEKERKKALARVASPESLVEAALAASTAERRAMEVEREIVDVYRCFYMLDHIGERYEGTVSAFVGSGAFVTLDEPFVDVMVKVEDLGGDFQIEEDGLMATSDRSGESIRLGDRIIVDISDVAILRRTVYARRAGASARRDSFARPTRGGGRGGHRGEEQRGGRRGGAGAFRKPEKPGKPERPGRPERPGTPGRPGKPGKPGKPGRAPSGAGKQRGFDPRDGSARPGGGGEGGGHRNKGGPGPARARKGKKPGRRR
jgi:ribonuclease R